MRKQVVFIANSLESAFKFRQVLSDLDADVFAGTTAHMKERLKPGAAFDLVIFEALGAASAHAEEIKQLADNYRIPLLVIIDEQGLEHLQLPEQVPSDFVLSDAGQPECAARIMHLVDGLRPNLSEDVIAVGDMAINLNTYQVTIAGNPLDLTYLEYALLAFLARHPGRTFSRDLLLQNVWGFDYYGGSRTVDVHVRRIRAKLGPGFAQHLETVRGVGYLWNPADR